MLDFGSQYAQLIARRVREKRVYSVLARPDVTAAELRELNLKGLIFTGGPNSVYDPGAPHCRPELLDLGVPILGICYGMQIACQMLGAEIQSVPAREYGPATLTVTDADALLHNLPAE
ncbi:MAG: GMP synthase (glutamine-hydrolyzing), partial [Candidatus Hydrogenedentes bacterium]|nr:GMP synthase (glutamine-hydrolyzing) [Candidatus Hydrogenedentota bacterium]